MTDNRDWRRLFVGRDDELDRLRASWRKVAPEDGTSAEPQLVVLLAESGLGKTRLVQEFYRWLSITQDPRTKEAPQGYWPDAFASETESLDVNPSFSNDDAGRGAIPWLWWGIRFGRTDRRNEVASHCGLMDYRTALTPHLTPILAARRLKVIEKGAAWKTLSLLGEFVPGAGLMFGLRDVWELLKKDRASDRQTREQLSRTPGQFSEQERLQAGNVALDYFRTVLDKRNTEAATVPVVLFLDDAQWADPVTLHFLSQLLDEARRSCWPLLVVCTHWEREWKETFSDPLGDAERPPRLSAVTESFRRSDDDYSDWVTVRTLPPVTDLSGVVHAAFPGLTVQQRREVLAKSGGNPLLLEEILLFLFRRPQFFESRELHRPLNPAGLQQLHNEKLDLEKLIDDRFQSLDVEVQRALGWCSEQGQSFLMGITLASAKRVDDSITEERLRTALRRAESPYSMIQVFGDPGQFNRSEFRQSAFHKVAKDYLRFLPDEMASVQEAIRDTLTAWLSTDDPAVEPLIDSLPEAEQLDVLVMARHSLSPNTSEPETVRRAWCQGMARLALLYRDQYLWEQAWDVAEVWAQAAPHGWPLSWIDFWSQVELRRILDSKANHKLAIQIVKPLIASLSSLAKHSPDRRTLRALSVACCELGDSYFAEGRCQDSLASFRRGLEIREQIVEQFGETPQSLNDLSVALNKLGRGELNEGHRRQALSHFRRGLKIRERIVEQFGETPEAMDDLSISLLKVGDVDVLEGRREEALASFHRGLEVNEQLAESLDSIRSTMLFHGRIADVELEEGRHKAALASFRRALEISEQLMEEFGETPQSLRDLSLSLGRFGNVNRNEGRYGAALV